MGAGALVALFLLERFLPKLPGGLILLVAAIAISAALDLASHGVATVGSIPTGLPTPERPRRGPGRPVGARCPAPPG